MKKVSGLLKLLVVFLVVVMVVSNVSLAAYDYASKITTLDSHAGNTDLNNSATKIVGAIISVTKIVAVGVAIIMLAAVAMKYMSSAPGDRAEIKKHAVIYIVGAIVLFGTAGILNILQKFGGSIGS